MITITITNTIATTIAIVIAITIAIAIAIAIISISPRLNAHTYSHNRWEAGTRFRWKISVRDLLSPRSNWLPLLQNLRLQLLTWWLWGIVRSCRGGCAKDKVQTMISTDVTISATISCPPSATLHTTCHPPNTTHHMPPASRLPVPGVCNSASLWIEHAGVYMGAYSQVRLGVYLGV